MDPILRRWRDIGPAHSGEFPTNERADQVIKPVDVGHAVRVGISKHFTFGRGRAGVASVTEAVIFLMNVTHVRKLRGDLSGVVGRTIIDQNHFVIWIIEFA